MCLLTYAVALRGEAEQRLRRLKTIRIKAILRDIEVHVSVVILSEAKDPCTRQRSVKSGNTGPSRQKTPLRMKG